MACGQCQGIEEIFSQPYVDRELRSYRSKGPIKTTRRLAKAIAALGVKGLTLLDIGGGVGAIQHELLAAGVAHATDIEASTAYIAAARAEARRRGLVDRVTFQHGNFVDLADDIAPADIVTLDRVICCYPDMENLVTLSARRARRLYGLVYPRDGWWLKIWTVLENFVYRLQRSPYRAFVHPTREVEAILDRLGFKRHSHYQNLIWQVAVYTRL